MSRLKSFFILLSINLQRLTDHLIRRFTGLPQLKRSEIAPEIFLGGQYGLHAISKMKKLQITGIINMRKKQLHDQKFAKSFRILHLPTPDRYPPTIAQLKKGVRFINREKAKNGKVYIHCREGEGRGPTMVIAYLISRGMTYADAFAHVKKVRTFINPTAPQREILHQWQSRFENKKKNSLL